MTRTGITKTLLGVILALGVALAAVTLASPLSTVTVVAWSAWVASLAAGVAAVRAARRRQ